MQTEVSLEQPSAGSVLLPGALKLKDAAAYCGVSPITIVRWVKNKYLFPNRAARHLLFPRAQLDEFLNSPRFTNRHTRLAAQCLPGATQWKKAVAARKANRKQQKE